jgi:hypothetical protein
VIINIYGYTRHQSTNIHTVIICEPLCRDAEHLPFIQATLEEILHHQKNEERILLLADGTMWENLKRQMEPKYIKKITFKEITILSREDSFISWIKAFFYVLMVRKLTLENEKITYLGTNAGIIGCSEFILKRNKVYCFTHMMLARIAGHIPKNPFIKCFSIKDTLSRLKNKNIKLIVLEDVIRENLIQEIPHLVQNVRCIPHPLPNDPKQTQKRTTLAITLCFPGTFTANKGAFDFDMLALFFGDNDLILFTVAGRKSINSPDYSETNYLIQPSTDYLERDIFLNILANSDYIFLGHDESMYKWCASGVYLDALCQEIPIIARRSEFLENEFLKNGSFGLLYDDINDLKSKLTSESLNKEYDKFKKNIHQAKLARNSYFKTALGNALFR